MRDQEDQMDAGSIGRTRGSGHVRIPQRRVNQSLRSGVSPGMNQMTGPQGHFTGAGAQRNYVPMRASSPAYGKVFNRFQNLNRNRLGDVRQAFQHRQDVMGQRQTFERQLQHGAGLPPRPGPIGDGGQLHFPNPGNGGPSGRPILGQGQQTVNGLLQALMGDLGNGMNAQQFGRLQDGSLPGMEHGDFAKGFGFGAGNDSIMKALAGYLTQGQDGSYALTDPSNTVALQHMLRGAIKAQNPNMPNAFHGGLPGGPGGIHMGPGPMQNPGGANIIGGGLMQNPQNPMIQFLQQHQQVNPMQQFLQQHQQQNPLQQLLQQRAGRRGQQFLPQMPAGQMGA